jgi:hypothetical protein
MSVNAGEVYIDVGANLGKLDAGLAQAKEKSVAAGKSAGFDFGAKFGEQAKGIVGQLAGPMIAATLAKGIASVLRSDQDMPTAILDAVKTIPFVGAFADLGSAIYEATFGAADKAAEDLIAKQTAARDSLLRAAGERRKEEAAGEAAAGGMTLEAERLRQQQELNALRAKGDAKAIADAEYKLKLDQLDLELQLKLAAEDVSDVELNALLRLNAEKRKLYAQERDQRIRDAEEVAAKEREAKEKQADAERQRVESSRQSAEDALKRARIEREEAGKQDDAQLRKRLRAVELEKELRGAASDAEREAIRERFRLEDETADIKAKAAKAAGQSFQAGSAQTALGTFTFDPYPPATQRSLDERMAKATEEVAKLMRSQGFT